MAFARIRCQRIRCEPLEDRLVPADVSAPAILQIFDGSYNTIERRMIDILNAGYGQIYSPPPGRADIGNFSVGYDVYDRFDLGGPGNPTLYGTEAWLRAAVAAVHQIAGNYYIDFVVNHNGFSDLSTVDGGGNSFVNAGGYPGFLITTGGDIDGDFHGAFEGGDTHMRLAGLIDIAQEKNYQYIRSPVPGFANNLPAGTIAAFGRLANVSDDNNRRFYPDRDLPPIMVFDPTTGESNIAIYPFNNANPLAGDPVSENAVGLLMRNAQWLVQAIGVDGFRIDAAKHVDPWVLNYIDRAVYRSSYRNNLDGSQRNIFSFSEVFTGDQNQLQSYIRKDIDPGNPGVVGGNRDVLDFPLFFAMRDNLTGNGFTNDWRNIVNASIDIHDDGLANNGSQGVAFVQSHDEFGPYLSNVAYAYMLMRPGNAVVYFNAKEYGPGRDFPKDGRGDALGGLYGDRITELVNFRNQYGRGNYIERWIEKEMLIFEREASSLVVLSNRLDGGFDSRTVQTSFAPGTMLIDVTGNSSDPVVDPFNDFPEMLVVNGDGTVNLRVPRNTSPSGVEHDRGYFIYAPATPNGVLSLTGVDHTILGETPTDDTNGTARLAEIDVVTGNSFLVRLNTNAVYLLGLFHDPAADGDNALIRLDSGWDVNGNGFVDYITPGPSSYRFEEFVTTHSPGYFNVDGNGLYEQTIDTTGLAEGMHYVTVRAYRHREAGEGQAIYQDYRRAVYVDRLPPDSGIVSFNPIVSGISENRRLVMRSLDMTANNMHVFWDMPAALTDQQILDMVGGGSQTAQIDRDLFSKDKTSLTHGNHVATVVTYEMSGNYNIQRFPGLFTSTICGAGLGDLDFDGDYDPNDINLFRTILISGDGQFNPAADLNGDGLTNNSDLVRLFNRLIQVNADAATMNAFFTLVGPLIGGYGTSEGNGVNFIATDSPISFPMLTFQWDLNNDGTFGDANGTNAPLSWTQLVGFGIDDSGAHAINLRVSDGGMNADMGGSLNVTNVAPTATLVNSGPINEGQSATVSFTNPFDPSPADTLAGFLVSYDFNNDGDFTDPGEATDVPNSSWAFPFSNQGTHQVHGQIKDQDGGTTDYTTTILVGDVDVIVTALDKGGEPRVRLLKAVDQSERFNFLAYDLSFRGGVRVAVGDVSGDGIPDIITGPGPGGKLLKGTLDVKVFDGITGLAFPGLFAGFQPFGPTFRKGVWVAAGDVDDDGFADVIVAPAGGASPIIKVFSGKDGDELHSLIVYPDTGAYRKGVRIAAGDVTGDGRVDIIAHAGSGTTSRLVVLDGVTQQPLTGKLGGFNPFDDLAAVKVPLFVAAGDVNGDGLADIITSVSKGTPFVRTFDAATGDPLATTQGNASGYKGGIRVAGADLDGDGLVELLLGTGKARGLQASVRLVDGDTLTPIDEFFAADPLFKGGVFVAGGK